MYELTIICKLAGLFIWSHSLVTSQHNDLISQGCFVLQSALLMCLVWNGDALLNSRHIVPLFVHQREHLSIDSSSRDMSVHIWCLFHPPDQQPAQGEDRRGEGMETFEAPLHMQVLHHRVKLESDRTAGQVCLFDRVWKFLLHIVL